MHWILQHNISTDEQRQEFVDALDTLKPLGATWSFVKLIPFIGDVIPDDDYTGRKVFALGSTSLIVAAQKRNWTPGVIFNDNFRYEQWFANWGTHLLNHDAVVCRFADAQVISDKAFLRPCEDLKAFTGHVIGRDELRDWQRRVTDGERNSMAVQLNDDTMVSIASAKVVMREWRFFVVGGKVITGSQYKTLQSTYSQRGSGITADVDADVYAFAQCMVDMWQPADCFVLDVAETNEGLSVIEVNCFNCSGIYACDIAAAFAAVERFYGQV